MNKKIKLITAAENLTLEAMDAQPDKTVINSFVKRVQPEMEDKNHLPPLNLAQLTMRYALDSSPPKSATFQPLFFERLTLCSNQDKVSFDYHNPIGCGRLRDQRVIRIGVLYPLDLERHRAGPPGCFSD